MARYKKLKHAKRRLIGQTENWPPPAPSELAPQQWGGAAGGGYYVPEGAGGAPNGARGAHALGVPPAVVDGGGGSSSSILQPAPPLTGGMVGGPVGMGGPSANATGACAAIPPSKVGNRPACGVGRADATPSPPPERPPGKQPSSKSPVSKRGAKKGKHSRKAAHSSLQDASHGGDVRGMTVSMKASHPSPRALGACDESFD